jgi:putative FmdB family regulatory protein
MPTYSYKCAACGHQFDRFQQMSERPVRLCPACGKRRVRRLIGTGAGIIFKGSGFYQTDYRSEEYKSRAKAESGSAAASSSAKPNATDKKSGENKGTTAAKD